MSTQIIPFEFHDRRLDVIVDENGAPWFIAKHVSEILEYTDAQAMTRRLDDEEKSNRQIVGLGPETGGRGVICINESGLYSAVLSSKKPAAKAFKKWVTSEVLPSIRKTGGYQSAPEQIPVAAFSVLQMELHILQRKYIDLLEDRLAEKPVFGAARPWTPEEDRRALALRAEGLGCTRIGYQLGRSKDSVERRFRRLRGVK